MAFDNGTQWEVQPSGSDTENGGGFSPAATMATDLSGTATNTASPVVSSLSYNFVSADEGHYLFIKAGTDSKPGWWRIVSTSANAATLDASVGAGVLYNGATPTNLTVGISNPTVVLDTCTWSVDYSRSNTPRLAYTDMVIDGTTNTKYTSAAKPVGPNIVGNIIVVTAGTGFTTQRVEVVSVSGTTATCDKSLGTLSSTGGTGGLGGALASPGKAAALVTATSHIYVKGSNTYTLSSSSNVAGGRMAPGAGCLIIGYTTTRVPYNLDANKPAFQSNGNTYSLITVGNPSTSCHCIDFVNGNSNTTIKGFDDGASGWGNSDVWNCKFNAISVGCDVRTNSQVEYCWFNACTGSALTSSGNTNIVRNNVFTGNTTLTFAAVTCEGNIFYSNGSGANGIVSAARSCSRNLFHTITGTGSIGAKDCYVVENNIFVNVANATGVAISGIATDNTAKAINNAFFNCTTDVATGSTYPGYKVINKISLTSDPITDPAGGDFSLNDVAGGGAELINNGFPLVLPGTTNDTGNSVGPSGPASSGGGATAYAF